MSSSSGWLQKLPANGRSEQLSCIDGHGLKISLKRHSNEQRSIEHPESFRYCFAPSFLTIINVAIAFFDIRWRREKTERMYAKQPDPLILLPTASPQMHSHFSILPECHTWESRAAAYIYIHSLTNKQKIQTRKKKLLKTERRRTEKQQAKLKNTGKESLVVPNRVTDSLANQIFALLADTGKDDEILLTSSDTLLPPPPPVGVKAPVKEENPTHG